MILCRTMSTVSILLLIPAHLLPSIELHIIALCIGAGAWCVLMFGDLSDE